jgi:hypothetical protein
MRNSTKTVLSLTALLGMSGVANAAPAAATLTGVATYSVNGSTTLNLNASTASWVVDTATGVATQTGGTFSGKAFVGKTPLYTHTMTGGVLSSGTATATSWGCAEGVFGGIVGAHICGNFTLGGNGTVDSIVGNSGTAVTVTIQGDDVASGDPQTLANSYSNMSLTDLGGGNWKLGNSAPAVDPISGYDFFFTVAPVPVADAADDGPIVTSPSVPTPIAVGANDVNFSDPVSVTISTPPLHGTIAAISDTGAAAGQTITYTAAAGYAGADSFVYSMTDGTDTDTATVTITVQPAQANDDAVSVSNGTATAINVLANDQGFVDPATVTITAGPAHGTATVSGSPGNKSAIRINYTPAAGYAGTDSISYQLDDGFNSDSATVTITVLSYKANDDKLVVLRDNCCQYVYVAKNDVGFGSQVTITLIQSPDHNGYAYVSSATGTKENVYIYYYPNGYNYPSDYTETFRYQISDGTRTDTATVSVEVVRYKAVDDQAVTGAGTPVTISVADNDVGFSNNYNRTVGIYSAPQHGSVTVGGSSYSPSIVYSPAPGFVGTDTFEYAIDDGMVIDIALVTVAVIVDADHDLVDDVTDNCLAAANSSQRDTDGDGYGNWCDADLNNDTKVNFADLSIFRARFATSDADADLDGNGNVNFADLARFKALFGQPLGPSAIVP